MWRVSGFRRIYALMQCIPGISSVGCDACLQANVRTYQGCCWGKQGGSITRPVCFFRFDPYLYLDAFDDIASSPPPPPQISQDPQDLQPTTSPPHPPPVDLNLFAKFIKFRDSDGVLEQYSQGFVAWFAANLEIMEPCYMSRIGV
ncbi:unnamed protein product [Brassica rapa]|uniref:Gnk2-homologous domain-containing protein n=1 Tax=Brassica campestris TaxID=3711 RepID=A0A8D9CPP4_BRACM|nr:unnamed protein product [Brassica rapa]